VLARVERVARGITELLAPAVLVSVLLVLLGWHSTGFAPDGLAFGAVAALFESVLPFAYIVRGVRRGELSDRHVGERSQRLRPLLVAFGSVVIGAVLLVVLDAPRQLLAAVAAGGVGLLVAAAINHWWKMSIHAAVAAGACVILGLVFGAPLLATAVLVGLVGWSRVRLGDHTWPQVLVGFAVGALVAGVVFAALR
jgi:hypothetical protein